jgi:anti-sigma-K factor RskA
MTHEQVRDLAAAFVLGALEADEEAAVREHLATCDQPHEEFAELGGVVAVLAESVELVEPPASLRSRIMEAAARDLETRRSEGRDASATLGVPERPATADRVVSLGGERAARLPVRLAWMLGLAAVLAIAALGVWNVRLRSDLDAAQAYRQHVEQVLSAAAQKGSHTAILTSTVSPNVSGLAVVGADGSVTVVMRGLAPTTGSKVYEAWVIPNANAAPIPIGGFTVAADGTGYLATTGAPSAAGVTVAVTLEPGPDATAPTPPIISAGVAG